MAIIIDSTQLRILRYAFLPETTAALVISQRRRRIHFLFGLVAIQLFFSYLLFRAA